MSAMVISTVCQMRMVLLIGTLVVMVLKQHKAGSIGLDPWNQHIHEFYP